ncbi:hypothetical protein [Bacteroides sp. CG01]|uniref:hypothetical protein n=1 Tax=Bacteroides TaxID=816 RepID=UPI002B001BAA|nr:hypothetical protein [Bacteroides sp. CG01]
MREKIIGLLILICLLGTYQYYRQMRKQCELQKMIKELQQYYDSEKSAKDFALSVLKEDMKLCFQNEGLILDSEILLVENESKEYILSDIVKEKTLVIRFSQLNCQACIEAIKPLLKKVNIKQVVFLVTYTNKKFLKEFKKEIDQEDWRFFQVNSLYVPVEDLNSPYFFVLDEKMSLNYVFIPHKEMLDQIERYFEIVEQHLC